jgi:hypothetical protein
MPFKICFLYLNLESSIHLFGRLFHQYLVDQYAKIEQGRLNYIATHQNDLRVDQYKGLTEAVDKNKDAEGDSFGKRIILPSSFTNGPRHMFQLYQDSMSVVRALGKPDLFVTFTCNP